jgi:hypothetical protein
MARATRSMEKRRCASARANRDTRALCPRRIRSISARTVASEGVEIIRGEDAAASVINALGSSDLAAGNYRYAASEGFAYRQSEGLMVPRLDYQVSASVRLGDPSGVERPPVEADCWVEICNKGSIIGPQAAIADYLAADLTCQVSQTV